MGGPFRGTDIALHSETPIRRPSERRFDPDMILHPASRSRRLGLFGLSPADPLVTALARRLDDDYHWFRSISSGGMEPIDAVLVGPGGTWTLSFAGQRGRFTLRNGHWYQWNRSTESWVPWEPLPITAARLAGRRLSLYLERAGLPASVSPILFAPADMSVQVAAHDRLGLVVEREPDRIASLMSGQAQLTQAQVDRIVALLDPRQPLPRLAPSTPNG